MASASSKTVNRTASEEVILGQQTINTSSHRPKDDKGGIKALHSELQSVKTGIDEGAPLAETAKRSLSLRDVKTSAEEAQEINRAISKDDTSDPVIPVLSRLSTEVDLMGEDPSSQFPSPSSGFVPPMTQEDFRLPEVSPSNRNANASTDAEIDRVKTPTIRKDIQRSPFESYPLSSSQTDEPSNSLSIPTEKKTLVSRSGFSRDSSSLSLLSSSSSSSSFDDGHSQAISARSSPSTVAPQKRRSSTSPIAGTSVSKSGEVDMIPLKVRDFAYTEVDPRHVGARDITIPSTRVEFVAGMGVDEEEGIEGGLEAQEESGLPIGLYHAAYDFAAESEHELSVQAGEKLRLIGHVEGGWAIVLRLAPGQEEAIIDEDSVPRSDKGLVPEAYLEWLA